jgi:molecular chaperone GrpE
MDGVALIEMQLRRALDTHEVKPLDVAPGAPFDPLRHESIGAVETADHPDGAIAAVVQSGYELRGFILRPALVQLAKAPAAEKSEDPATSATAGASSRSTGEGS